jgi:hypothetical protein
MKLPVKSLAPALTALLVAGSAAAFQAPRSKPQAPPRQNVDGLLREAHELYGKLLKRDDQAAYSAAVERFKRVILEARSGFEEVSGETGERARYAKVGLNGRGNAFDGLRFRTPSLGKEYRLFVDVVVPGNTEETSNLIDANFMPVEGDFLSLRSYGKDTDVRMPGVDLPAENTHLALRLGTGIRLRAGADYVFWFNFRSGQPTPTFLRVRLEPVQPTEPPASPVAQKARSTFQGALEALNERYDAEVKSGRRKYLLELDKAARSPAIRKDRQESDRILAEADRINRGDSEAGDPQGLRILRAEYGEGDRWVDVTMPLRALIRGGALIYDPGENAVNGFKPDPSFGTHKTMIIIYALDGVPGVSMTLDNQRVELPVKPPAKEPAATKP